MGRPIEIKCEGKTFLSVFELASYYGASPSTVARRLRSGWSVEEAVGISKHKNLGHGTRVILNGKEFRTIQDACNFLGLNPETIRARIRNGYSLAAAFAGDMKKRVDHPRSRHFHYKGIHYPSGSAIASAFGCPSSKYLRHGGS